MSTAQLIRIDFAEFTPGRVVIDGRPAGSGRPAPPFTVRALLPGSLWCVGAATALAGWADRSAVVQLRFRQGRESRQVVLSDERFVMALDLDGRPGDASERPIQALLVKLPTVPAG